MAKLIQICASENDLFGLDGEGVVYHYNFSTNTWLRLGSGQRARGESAPAGGRPPGAVPGSSAGDGAGHSEAAPAPERT